MANLGSLTLDLIARVGGFTQSMDKAANSTQKNMKQIEESVNKAKSTINTLFALSIGAYSAKSLIDMADSYGQMADRIRQATSSTEEYNKVQQRLLQSANATYRPLEEAQELFIRTSNSLKSLGYDTEQALDITDSLSYLLVTNAASADKASSAINALSKSVQTGKVNSESWQSILAATPTIVDNLASSLGISRKQVEALGITGKISLQQLLEALRLNVNANKELADAMGTSVNDALVRFRNNLKVLVGQQNEAYGVTAALAKGINLLSDNINILAGGALVAISARVGAYAGSMVASTIATASNAKAIIANIAAQRADLVATAERTAYTVAQTAAELTNAQAIVARTTGMARLTAVQTTLIPAQNAHTAALAANTAAQTAANAAGLTAANVGRGLVGVLGGPVGIGAVLGITAASYLLFRDNTDEANKASIAHIKTIEQLKKELIGLTEIELLNKRVAFGSKFEEEAQKATASLNKLRQAAIRDGLFDSFGTSQQERIKLTAEYTKAIDEATSKGEDIGALTTKFIEQIKPTKEVTDAIIQYAAAFSTAKAEMSPIGGYIDVIADKIQALRNGLKEDKPTNNDPLGNYGGSKQLDAITNTIKRYKEQVATLGLSNKEIELYKLQTQGATQAQLKLADSLLTQVESFNKAKEATKGQIEQQQWLAAQTDALNARLQSYQISLSSMSMGSKQAQDYQELIAIQQEYANARKQLIEAQAGENKITEQQFQERLVATDGYYSQLLQKTRDYQQQRDELEQSWTGGFSKAWEDYRDNSLNYSKQAGDFFNNTVSTMNRSLSDFVMNGKASFTDFTKSILGNIADIAVQIATTQAIRSLFGSYFASSGLDSLIGSSGLFAKGGAFVGGVQAFADGGAFTNSIVNKPTLFPFANGIGLMGEAGAEAIMPLTRTSSGELGVKAISDTFNGGSNAIIQNVAVNVTVNSDGSSNVDTSEGAKDLGLIVQRTVQDQILKEKRQGGLLDPNSRRNQ